MEREKRPVGRYGKCQNIYIKRMKREVKREGGRERIRGMYIILFIFFYLGERRKSSNTFSLQKRQENQIWAVWYDTTFLKKEKRRKRYQQIKQEGTLLVLVIFGILSCKIQR